MLPVEIRALREVPQEITVRNRVLNENIIVETLFITVIPRGTYFIARISTGSLLF
jgi:hypothetical protein